MSLCLTGAVLSNNNNVIGFQLYDIDNRAVSYKKLAEAEKFLMNGHRVRDLVINNGFISTLIPIERLTHIYKDSVQNIHYVVLKEGRAGYQLFMPDVAVKTPLADLNTVIPYKLDREDKNINQMIAGLKELRLSNGQIGIDKDYNIMIAGNFPRIKRAELTEAQKAAGREKARVRDRISIFARPMMRTVPAKESHLHDVDEACGMTVEQKMAYLGIALRDTSPFLYGIYKGIVTLEAEPGLGLDTMGVSVGKMYFCSKFVQEKPLDELLFIMIHEMYHLIFKHPARGENKIQKLFNAACDLYVNRAIAIDYNLRMKSGESTRISNNRGKDYKMIVPDDCLYNGSINVDVNTPEEIYEQLYKEVQKKQQQNSGKGQKGQSSQSSQSGQGGQGSEQSDTSNNGNGQGGNGQGGNGDYQDSLEQAIQEVLDELAGGKGKGKNSNDLVTNSEERGKSKEQLKREARAIVQRGITLAKKQGYSLNGSNSIERIVIKENAPKVNWKSVLKNKMTKATQRTSSFATPDRRFLSRDKIFPGPRMTEPDSLGEIVIGVDTSGSISDKELGIAFAQINQLLTQFHATGTLFWWDTKCSKPVEFKDFKDLLRAKPTGGGGTDPNVLFEEIYAMTKKNPLKQPTAILVFTDGYFGKVDEKWRKYRDTIWIIFESDVQNFEAPFGVVAPFKTPE